MTCTFSFTGPDGQDIKLVGKPALKAYLASGGLAHLLPKRAIAAGIEQAMAPAFSQSTASPAQSKAIADTFRLASGILSRFENAPNLEIVDSIDDPRVPEAARAENKRQKEGGSKGNPEGFLWGGTVYLINSELKTSKDVARVLFHETLGHYGLRGVFGDALDGVLEQIITAKRAEVVAKAKAYGLKVSKPEDMLTAAEEVLAEMAQTRPNIGIVQRAIAAIRTWLRKNVPGLADMSLSDEEIVRDFILPARAFVERGEQAGRDMAKPALSRAAAQTDTPEFKRWFGDSKVVDENGEPLVVYHGTLADFSEFDLDYSAENAIFFSSDPKHAEGFAGTEGGNIIPAYVALQNPLYVDGKKIPSQHDIEDIERFVLAAKAEGRDGLIIKNMNDYGDVADVYVAFRPEQIKSATGNVGAYGQRSITAEEAAARGMTVDEANAAQARGDISFSRSPVNPVEDTSLTPPEQGMLRKVQAAVQDNMNRVRQVQNRIEKITGKKLTDQTNYYGAETNRPGRIAARLEDARNQLTGPLMKRLAKSGFKAEDLSELLHAMHAQERNEAVESINPDVTDGSGMTTEKANEILAKRKNDRELHAIADDARRIASETLSLKRAYGLIDQETYDTLSTRYQNYVPLKGDGEYGPKIKRAMGHEERDEQILENIARDYDQAVVVGEKNLARHALLAMVLTNPDKNLWTVGVPPKGRYVAGAYYEVPVTGDSAVKFTSLAEATAFSEQIGSTAEIAYYAAGVKTFVKNLQDNEVMVYVDGQPVRIQINGDEQLARQVRPLNQGQMNPILEGMRSMTRYLSKIYTGYNPAFILKNAARDASTGTINIMGSEGTVMAAKAWANYPAALKTLAQWATTKKIPAGETGKYLAEYRAQGGKVGASYMSDLEQQGETLQRLFDDAYGAKGYLMDGKPTKAALIAGRKIVSGMAHVVEIANQSTENGLRLALFMAMRKSGVSAAESARAAKNVTVDFDRKGSMTGALGAIYLFFNPAVQGTANALKTLTSGKHRAQALTAIGGLGLLGVYAAATGMDDDPDRWLGENWGTRSKNFILDVGGHHITVPMSQEFTPFYAMGVAIAEAMRGESAIASSARIMSSFIDAYIPFRGLYDYDSKNHGLDAADAMIPTVIKPGFELATNHNSFGTQITPENDFTKDRPDNLKMFRGTKNSVYESAAQGIAEGGQLLGAGKYENDISKVSPETLKFLWRTYTGGLGQFVTDTAGFTRNMSQAPGDVTSSEVPFVKDFYKANDVKPIRGRFYDLAEEVKKVSVEFAQAKKAGDGPAMDEILAQPRKAQLLSLDRLVKLTAKSAAQIRDEEVDINADTKMTPQEKKAALKELERQEEILYRSAIGAFK